MIVDHICFAVKDLQEAIVSWRNLFGYNPMTEIVDNSRQKVKVVFLSKEESITIKLIEPQEDNKSLLKFVRFGGGIHHVCFKCSNIEETIADFEDKGLTTLVPPQPGEAFGNENIAFMRTRFGVTLELIDTDVKAGLIKK